MTDSARLIRDVFFLIIVGSLAYANVSWGVMGLLNTILLCWSILMYFSVLSDRKESYSVTFFGVIFAVWALMGVMEILQIPMSTLGLAHVKYEILKYGIAPFLAFIVSTMSTYRNKMREMEESMA